MSNVTVGLYKEDSRMYYIDKSIAILNNPFTHIPTLVVRSRLNSIAILEMSIKKALRETNMEPIGEPYYRADGLLCQSLKEASNGKK